MREINWFEDIKSFLKTFATVFIGMFLLGYDQGIEVFTGAFLFDAFKVSFISVIRTVYKLIDES